MQTIYFSSNLQYSELLGELPAASGLDVSSNLLNVSDQSSAILKAVAAQPKEKRNKIVRCLRVIPEKRTTRCRSRINADVVISSNCLCPVHGDSSSKVAGMSITTTYIIYRNHLHGTDEIESDGDAPHSKNA